MQRRTFDEAANLTHAIGLLARRVRAAGSRELSWNESAVMARIATDGPATTANLARAEAMKPQSMGAIIAALSIKGLVQGKPHPKDGRQINIELTPKGIALRESIRDAKHAWLAVAIAQLDKQERKVLNAATRIIKRLAEARNGSIGV